MGFCFSLAVLLRLREIAEQREERLLGQIQQQITQCHQTLLEIKSDRTVLADQRYTALQRSTSAYNVQGLTVGLQQLDDRETAAKAYLADLTNLRAVQLKVYEGAHQSRVVLSDMRSVELDKFHQDRDRQEQHATADTFLSRRRLH